MKTCAQATLDEAACVFNSLQKNLSSPQATGNKEMLLLKKNQMMF